MFEFTASHSQFFFSSKALNNSSSRLIFSLFTSRFTPLKCITTYNVLQLTNELNQFTQEPLAQFGEVSETLSTIYQRDINQIEEIFKQSAVVRTNWASHVILLNSKLPLGERYWYITQAVANGWSSNVLQMQIETNLFAQQITTKKVSNFSVRLPKPQSDLANYLMKAPYIFDVMG